MNPKYKELHKPNLLLNIFQQRTMKLLSGVLVCVFFGLSLLPNFMGGGVFSEILRIPLYLYTTSLYLHWSWRKSLRNHIVAFIKAESPDNVNTLFQFLSNPSNRYSDILRGATLNGCDLSNTKIENLDLTGADLSGASLENAKLNGITLKRARFNGANLKNLYATGCNFSKACFKDVDFSGAEVQASQLVGADLQGAICRNMSLFFSKLDFANLMNTDLSEADLQTTRFVGANLTKANLHKAHAEYANFLEANLNGVDLTAAYLENAILHRTNLEDTKFDERTILPNNYNWTIDTDMQMFVNK